MLETFTVSVAVAGSRSRRHNIHSVRGFSVKICFNVSLHTKVLPSITNDALSFVPVVAREKPLTYLHRQLLSDLLNRPAPKFDKVGKYR